MSMVNCKVCGQPLNQSQYSPDGRYKSCPKCSADNEEEHVYYKYPESFGITEKRSTTAKPEGPQSYCVPCRGRGSSVAPKLMCGQIKK